MALATLVSCAPASPKPPEPVPPPAGANATSNPPAARPSDSLAPVVTPAEAALLGWMPLASTNVPGFLGLHPGYDGRGVIIAVLDGGIDPVAGLDRLPDGSPKVVEVRDFSSEGRIALAPVEVAGDFVRVGGRTLRGAGRLRGLMSGGVAYGGALRELTLGEPPAADIDGNGVVGDTLPVVVVRASDGWVLLTDTNEDGSLADERPVRDFAVAGDRFAWHAGTRPAPLSVAVNLSDGGEGQPPVLDLVFDTSGHGTHVAGIAAGYRLYGVGGFDGVAPGAELVDLKIANDAMGGITRTGSMIQAIDYAIRFAGARRKPLVINLSYGVGNEAEGRARIDAMLDSVLAAHPEVVLVLSAGNDGPGLSTIGFPASARRVISVGASYPGAFLSAGPDGRHYDDQVAFFSSRGGELARPDLVAPGVAYSTVPRWHVGEEIENGTSMAAPHVAGIAALLLSGLRAEGRTVPALTLRRALMGSSRPLRDATVLDQGAGQVDALAAWDLLGRMPAGGPITVSLAAHPELSGAWRTVGLHGLTDTTETFHLERAGSGPEEYQLRSDADWLLTPRSISLDTSASVTLRYRPGLLRSPGVHVGVVEGWGADSVAGPAFRLVNTVVVPLALPASVDSLTLPILAGESRRTFIAADSGHPIRIVVSEPKASPFLTFLQEPGGMPWRGGQVQVAGGPDSAAVFALGSRDVSAGAWELITMAGPAHPVTATVVIDPAPVRIDPTRDRDTVVLTVTSLSGAPFAGRVELDLLGGERGVVLSSRGSADRRVPFFLPAWADSIVAELHLDRDEWPRFTDFGFTLLDADGRQLGHGPMNYAIGRLETKLPPGARGRMAELVLSPGFADPGAGDLWNARLAIRLFAGRPVSMALPDSGGVRVPAGGTASLRLTLPPLPWTLGDGFFPLARATARAGDRSWASELGLPNRLPPVMP